MEADIMSKTNSSQTKVMFININNEKNFTYGNKHV